MLQKRPLKLSEHVLVETLQRGLVQAVGDFQFSVGPRAQAHVAAELTEAATHSSDVEAILSVDVAINAFGSLYYAPVYRAVAALCPALLCYLT